MFTQIRADLESGRKGLGIGLTLVKRLVELHGGVVDVESGGINLGSCFRVRLPSVLQTPSTGQLSENAERSAQGATPRRVLVVDDNADALKTLSMLVKLMGHDVCEAHDGVEAVHLAEQYAPDVVLMDIGMPNLNGYQAAHQIRDQPWGSDMTLVATTGWGQVEDRRRTKAAGFDHHLVKPIDHSKLCELLALTPRKQSANIQRSSKPRLPSFALTNAAVPGGSESNGSKPLRPILPR
jgi:CheY-like chemotaxis protein